MTNLPTYWTWAEPLGTAASHPRINQLVRVSTQTNLGADRGAAGTADAVDADVVSLGLSAGAVGVLLQNWGNTYSGGTCRLWRHPDDQLSGSDVPFFANGVQECRTWTRSFIARYLSNGTAEPFAFWMDTESRIIVNNIFSIWSDIQSDPRWSSEEAFPNGETWADQTIPAPGSSLSDPSNFPWIRAVRPLLIRSQSYAMKRGFFDLIQKQWPQVLTSNWVTTHDGAYLASSAENNTYGVTVGATHQAPVLYGNSNDQFAGPDRGDYARAEYPLKITQSAIQYETRPHSPWILSYGEGGSGLEGLKARDYYDAVIRQGVEDGIEHYLVWSNTLSTEYLVEANWNAFVDEIEYAESVALARIKALQEADELSNKASQTYTKHPDETRRATMSFRHKLTNGDSLTGTPTVTSTPSGPTISNVAVTSAAIEGDYINASASEAVQFTIAGGVDGTTYRLKVACNTAGGEVLVGLADITVEDEA